MATAVAAVAAPAAAARTGPVLRPYQREAIDATYRWVTAHEGHPLIVLPTGSGKSLVMGTLAAEALEAAPHVRVLILAHRKELLQQNARAVATAMPLGQIGIYSAGLNKRDTTSPVIVAGIQSMARKPHILGAFDLVLVDEAHLVPTEHDTMYRKTIEALRIQNPNVRFVGLTATPYRLTSGLLHRGQGALFSDIAYEANVADLIVQGYLCPLISKATLARLNTAGVQMRGGEYIPGQLEAAVDKEELTSPIVDELLTLGADRRKWLLFCSGVSHAEHVAAALTARGIPAEAVHGELSPFDRARILEEFRAGALRAVTSMDVLTTGYDEPAIDLIALLRPTKSTGLYVQMVGRGFRLHPSKQNTLVLDFAKNVETHGPVDAITVDDAAARSASKAGDSAPLAKACSECQSLNPLPARECRDCGHEFPPPPPAPAKIDPKASTASILTSEPPVPTWHEVTEVHYYRHQAKDEMGLAKTPTLRVEYCAGLGGFRVVAREWVCLEHEGYPRRKAETWWRERSPDANPEVPTVVNDVTLCLAIDTLLRPTEIATLPDGKWTRIVDYRFPGQQAKAPNGLPQACWTCSHWLPDGSRCLKWNASPPVDVQKIGCDAWEDLDDQPLPF